MNKEALNKIAPHLMVAAVRPASIQFDTNIENVTEDFLLARTGALPSFSRMQWSCIGQAIGVNENIGEFLNEHPKNFISFLMDTSLILAAEPKTGPLPDEVAIPEDMILAKIGIKFTIDYLTHIEPSSFEPESIAEFVQYNVPYHMWPYWRELIQNLCIRAQLPVPVLPPHVMPGNLKNVKAD